MPKNAESSSQKLLKVCKSHSEMVNFSKIIVILFLASNTWLALVAKQLGKTPSGSEINLELLKI